MPTNPNPMIRRCIQVVLSAKGEVTISQVLAAVGRYISAAQAVPAARKLLAREGKHHGYNQNNPIYTPDHLAYLARRDSIRNILGKAARKGLIRRVAPGVYAAPLPKLYEPNQAM